MNSNQPDMFSKEAKPLLPVTIELKGLGPIPSFKNRKRILAWLDKALKREEFRCGEYWIAKKSIKILTALITQPDHQQWMDTAISHIESQLRSALVTTGGVTLTGASVRSQIASLVPLDDCWTSFREVVIKSELCEPGEEGATITITRL
jgi:hypothetical protein